MDTNEDCERFNRTTKMHIQPPAPCESSFQYVYAEHGLYLETTASSLSLWKEKDDRCKQEKFTSTGSLLRYLEHDTLLKVLSHLDFQTLIRCMVVGRSLRNLIRSANLRQLWSENQPPVMLLTSLKLPCVLWVNRGISDSSAVVEFQPLSQGLNLPEGYTNPLAVASHRGLVCLRFIDQEQDYDELDLVVGNPLTGDWVALPRSPAAFEDPGTYNYRFTMDVGETPLDRSSAAVSFKVAAYYTSIIRHCYHVFDSVTGEWSSTKLFFPPRTAFKWSAFDLRSCLWRTELIPNWEIKTGLERSPAEVHRLPHPKLHGFCHWEYNGSTFFASVWTVLQPNYEAREDSLGEFAGYGVWKMAENGQRLETVAAVWGVDVGTIRKAVRLNVWYKVDCSAAGKLVWFHGESELSPTMPAVVVYDMETGRWSVFDEQHEAADEDSAGDHYMAAVLYSPSLLVAPSPSTSRSLMEKEGGRMRRCSFP